MKQELTLTGKVEISRTEVAESLKEWLKAHHGFSVTGTRFLVKGNSIEGAVVDVIKTPREPEPKVKVVGKIVNRGIFPMLREYFQYERKNKTKTVNFDDLFTLVHAEYPSMTPEKLGVYLYDRRLLDVRFDGKEKVIHLGEGK